VFPPQIFPASGIKADGSSLSPDEWAQFDPVSKVFLMEVLGKCVPYKCVNGGTSKGSFACARGGVYQCEVEQHMRKKTHKPNALRFWVEGGVIPLYVVCLNSYCLRSS